MASTIFVAFTLYLLASVAFSLPLAHDSYTVESSDSAHDRRLMKSSSDIDIVTVLSHREDRESDIKLVKILDSAPSFDAVVAPSLTDSLKRLRRTKRKVIMGHGCPDGMIWFTKCVSYQE